jgi:signal transduction histidine kinase
MNSLRGQLFLSYVGVILVCLTVIVVVALLLLFVVSPRVQERTDELRYDELNRTLAAILAAIESGQQANLPVERLGQVLRQTVRLLGPERRILLLNEQGRVLVDTAGVLGDFQPLGQIQTQPDGRERGIFDAPNGSKWLFVAADLKAGATAGRAARIVVAARQTRIPLWSLVTESLILPQLALAGLAGLVLSLLLAVIIARSVAQPLQRMAHAAQAVARGDYSQPLAASGPDEVKELAASFNDMARQVQAGQEIQRDFVANVSHELKTPLTSIQGFAQAILDGTATDAPAVRHAASVIHDEAERMRRLAEDLLVLARLQSGQMTLRREPVNVKEVLRACANRFALRAERAGVQLEVQTPDLPPIHGDGDRLGQVFSNLIDNALVHTPPEGRVTVRAFTGAVVGSTSAKADNMLMVEVSDTGSGIPAEDLPRIFERFYQVDKSRARAGSGAGLGLAISREIVQAHGGTITAESAPGHGARFTVRLPLDGLRT